MRSRRLGGFLFHSCLFNLSHVAFLQQGQCFLFLLSPIHLFPAKIAYRASRRLEQIFPTCRNYLNRIVYHGRIKGCDSTSGDQVIHLFQIGWQFIYRRCLRSGNNGMVIAHLGIIKDAFGEGQLTVLPGNPIHKRLVFRRQLHQRLLGSRQHIHRQIPAVRTGIGNCLPLFIQFLCDLQRFVCCKTQLAVGISLQAGQIIQLRSKLLLFFPADSTHDGFSSFDPGSNGIRLFFASDAGRKLFFLYVFIKPHALIIAKAGTDSIIFFRLEICDFMIPAHQNCQCRRLHTSNGQKHVETEGKGATGIHPYQPVCIGAGLGASIQSVVFRCRFQRIKAFPDGFIRHGRDPQTHHRLFTFGLTIDEPEDQFAFTSGICCANHLLRFRVIQPFFHNSILLFGFRQYFGGNAFRQNGQIIHAPFLIALIHLIRFAKADQMPQRPGNDILVVLYKTFALFAASQHSGNIMSHTGFFRYHNDHAFTLLSAPHHTRFSAELKELSRIYIHSPLSSHFP